MVATRARSGVTSPLPSGCTRLERKITKVRVNGSIQIEVPVNPVWPNDPIGSSSPRLPEKLESMSQPRPRTAVMPSGVAGRAILATVSGDSTRAPFHWPPPSTMRAKIDRSCPVLNSPACPATPSIRRAVGSWTTPRSIGTPGLLHGHASGSQASVGAMRPRMAASGRNVVSFIPSGLKTFDVRNVFSGCFATFSAMWPRRKKPMSE